MFLTRRNTFEPQIGSSRLKLVTLVPLRNEFVKFGTIAQFELRRFELNSGIASQSLVPVDFNTTLLSLRSSERIRTSGGGRGRVLNRECGLIRVIAKNNFRIEVILDWYFLSHCV